MILAANVIEHTDKMAAAYLAAKGTSGSGYGLGDVTLARTLDFGYTRKLRDQINNIKTAANWSDDTVVARQISALNTAVAKFTNAVLMPTLFNDVFNSLDIDCKAAGLAGVTDLRSFLSYYNTGTGGPYTCLVCPDFAILYTLVRGAANPILPTNVYSPAISNMAALAFGGSLTPGTSVDTTKYAGVALAQIIAASITGTGLVTVTGNGYGANGLAFTGHIFTVNVTGNGTFNLVPSVAGDIMTSVTGITMAAGITAGNVTVAGVIPSVSGAYSYVSGRTNPPA